MGRYRFHFGDTEVYEWYLPMVSKYSGTIVWVREICLIRKVKCLVKRSFVYRDYVG